MVKKKEQEIIKTEKRIENIEETLNRSEEFLIKNQKSIIVAVLVVFVVVLGYFGYQKYILEPKTQEAEDQIFYAQQFFKADSLDKALYGDGNHLGFLDIAEEYSSTKPGNLANFYAGIAFLRKGDFDKAIDYLQKFDLDDKMVAPMAVGAIGDAYLEKGDTEKAISKYAEAAAMRDNTFTAPLFYYKAAQTCEINNNYQKALEYYQIIKKKYPTSKQGGDIDRYIARAQAKLGK